VCYLCDTHIITCSTLPIQVTGFDIAKTFRFTTADQDYVCREIISAFNTQYITHLYIFPFLFNKLGAIQYFAFTSVQLSVGFMDTLNNSTCKYVYIQLHHYVFTQSSITSFTAVIDNTITKGTSVVHLEVGDTSGICYEWSHKWPVTIFINIYITWIQETNKKKRFAYFENSSYKNFGKKLIALYLPVVIELFKNFCSVFKCGLLTWMMREPVWSGIPEMVWCWLVNLLKSCFMRYFNGGFSVLCLASWRLARL
jgi:hypothetical protein